MKFLLDENLSPRVAEFLRGSCGWQVTALTMFEMSGCSRQSTGSSWSVHELRNGILISADADFSQLLAASGTALPSVILFRRESDRRASS